MKKKYIPYSSFDKDLNRRLKNPAFRAKFENSRLRFEAAYKIIEMRSKSKLTQKQFAKKLKVSQSLIARIEQGAQNLTLNTLHKLARACGKELKLEFI